MEHVLTRNGLGYTCLRCHQVLESQEDYDRTSCAVDADQRSGLPAADNGEEV